jgi:hypothetical protein
MSPSTLRDTIAELVRQGGPKEFIRDIWLENAGPDVPDQTITDFVEAVNSAFAAA